MPGSSRHEHGIRNQTRWKSKKKNRRERMKEGRAVSQHVGWTQSALKYDSPRAC